MSSTILTDAHLIIIRTVFVFVRNHMIYVPAQQSIINVPALQYKPNSKAGQEVSEKMLTI